LKAFNIAVRVAGSGTSGSGSGVESLRATLRYVGAIFLGGLPRPARRALSTAPVAALSTRFAIFGVVGGKRFMQHVT